MVHGRVLDRVLAYEADHDGRNARTQDSDRVYGGRTRAEVVAGNSDRVMTVGINWYLNRWVKVRFNVVHDTLRDPSQGPSPGQPGFWSRVLRFQLSL